MRSFYFRRSWPARILTSMSNERERVISISLSEAEWQAFVARQPQPVHWIRERIRDEVQAPTETDPPQALASPSAA
jgi:hypothetical protein